MPSSKKKVGITGQSGFIGYHLYQTLQLNEQFENIEFQRSFFDNEEALTEFVSKCDVIIHLAGVNRADKPEDVELGNILLAEKLTSALRKSTKKIHLIYTSSTQEELDNPYGNSKRKARETLNKWALETNSIFTGLIVPNIFGPFCKPNYNSFIATFCNKIIKQESPQIINDSEVNLLYVQDLIDAIVACIENETNAPYKILKHNKTIQVSEVLQQLNYFKDTYIKEFRIPQLNDHFDIQLFNTFRSYIPLKDFPFYLKKNEDNRGNLTELVRAETSGQLFFSTTLPYITRGNHFHTRKFERFCVVKGKARIQLRKIGTSEVFDFDVCGDEPAFIDMPVWHTHNITNTGDHELLTLFWSNEFFNPDDTDTFFESV